MAKIVVLDGQTANPGDLSWEPLHALGEVTIYQNSTPAELVARAAGAQVVIDNKMLLSAEILAQLPELRCVCLMSTGTDVIDCAAARSRGIVVCNVPAYSTASVVQLTFALLLELTQQVGLHAAAVRAGEWCRAADFCFWKTPLLELAGETLGVVGFGAIGRSVATVARAFGMKVVATSRTPPAQLPEGVTWTGDTDALLAQADAVSLHCPHTPATEQLINARTLALMKPTALLINTSRGRLLNEGAVAAALNEGRLAGAAMDVLSTEPPTPDNPLLTARNCVITPHLAWATQAARQRLLDATVCNVSAFLDGRPQNVVNA